MTIWRGPLLIAAALTAIAGVTVTIAMLAGAVPAPIGPAVQWGLSGASLSFTVGRVVHTRRVRRRELELLLAGVALLLVGFVR